MIQPATALTILILEQSKKVKRIPCLYASYKKLNVILQSHVVKTTGLSKGVLWNYTGPRNLTYFVLIQFCCTKVLCQNFPNLEITAEEVEYVLQFALGKNKMFKAKVIIHLS